MTERSSVVLRALGRLGRSLGVRCSAALAAYALAIVGLITGIGMMTSAAFDDAFPSMGTVLRVEDDLARDRFGVLQSRQLANCLIVVFDADGSRLFASSERATEKIRASDLPLINDYSAETFYEVLGEQGPDGLRHRILRCRYGGPDGETKMSTAWCLLDDDLRILGGSLFPGRDVLSEREFNFIKGVYDARMSVERLDYVTEDGEERTLVLAAPLVTSESYARVTDEVGRLWLLAPPLALVATLVMTLTLVRMVRRAARPIDRAIETYGRDGRALGLEPAERAGVPTELAPVYENLRYLMRRLDEARDDYRRLVAGVSHDLKTPLTVIRGYAQALGEGRVRPDRREAYLGAILRKAVAASELLDELASYSCMEHPAFEAHLAERDVCGLVAEAVESAQDLARQAGCTLEARLDPVPAVAMVDEALLRRVVLNLVGNSFAHNDPGTRVLVTCRRERATGARGTHVRLSVLDDGVGFTEEMARTAFSPFVTSNVSRAEGGGTGLGLTIVERAVELMGGTVAISPRPPAPYTTELVVVLRSGVPPLPEGATEASATS